jgi:hypothetical protein
MNDIKMCTKCQVPKGRHDFYKHRNVCKQCRIDYDKNRKQDLKDGVRDNTDWYQKEISMDDPRVVEILKEIRDETAVLQMPERELRNTIEDSEAQSRYVFYAFVVSWAVIIFVVVDAIVNYTGG